MGVTRLDTVEHSANIKTGEVTCTNVPLDSLVNPAYCVIMHTYSIHDGARQSSSTNVPLDSLVNPTYCVIMHTYSIHDGPGNPGT